MLSNNTGTDLTDAAIIVASQRDPALFAQIFDRHWTAVHRYCVSRAGADLARRRHRRPGFVARGRKGGVSAPAAGEPRGPLDAGMGVALRYDRRWLRRRSGHLGRRDADAHNNPVRATLADHPARTRIRSAHPLDLGHGLVTIHDSQDSP
jgi:hypothetical protein